MKIIKNLAHILTINYPDSYWRLIDDDYEKLEWLSEDDKPIYEELKELEE